MSHVEYSGNEMEQSTGACDTVSSILGSSRLSCIEDGQCAIGHGRPIQNVILSDNWLDIPATTYAFIVLSTVLRYEMRQNEYQGNESN